MKIDVVDYVETKDGGALVIFEMDEETRTCLISEALTRRLTEGLEKMVDEQETIDIEEYIASLDLEKD